MFCPAGFAHLQAADPPKECAFPGGKRHVYLVERQKRIDWSIWDSCTSRTFSWPVNNMEDRGGPSCVFLMSKPNGLRKQPFTHLAATHADCEVGRRALVEKPSHSRRLREPCHTSKQHSFFCRWFAVLLSAIFQAPWNTRVSTCICQKEPIGREEQPSLRLDNRKQPVSKREHAHVLDASG